MSAVALSYIIENFIVSLATENTKKIERYWHN